MPPSKPKLTAPATMRPATHQQPLVLASRSPFGRDSSRREKFLTTTRRSFQSVSSTTTQPAPRLHPQHLPPVTPHKPPRRNPPILPTFALFDGVTIASRS